MIKPVKTLANKLFNKNNQQKEITKINAIIDSFENHYQSEQAKLLISSLKSDITRHSQETPKKLDIAIAGVQADIKAYLTIQIKTKLQSQRENFEELLNSDERINHLTHISKNINPNVQMITNAKEKQPITSRDLQLLNNIKNSINGEIEKIDKQKDMTSAIKDISLLIEFDKTIGKDSERIKLFIKDRIYKHASIFHLVILIL